MLLGYVILGNIYIYNLDFEYETRGSFKLVYSYIQASDSSRMIWNQATLSSEFAALPCNKLYTLVYLLSEWNCSVIIIHDKYHRQFLFGFNACLQCHFAKSMLFATFLHKLGRVATFGDLQGIWYKRRLQPLCYSEAVYASVCSGKSLSSLSSLSDYPFVLFFIVFIIVVIILL